MIRAMCYKEIKTGETYLAYVSDSPLAKVQKDADRINTEKPERLWNRMPALCDERIYFAQEQEEFY